jgi:hypothetical protein
MYSAWAGIFARSASSRVAAGDDLVLVDLLPCAVDVPPPPFAVAGGPRGALAAVAARLPLAAV